MPPEHLIQTTGTLLLLLLVLPGSAAETEEHDQIIYISSYGPSYIWNQEIEDGIHAAIADSGQSRIQLSIEYLDTKVIDDPRHLENMYGMLSHKYQNAEPDVIITSDDAALLFMQEYGEHLFPDVPVVFTGVNNVSNVPESPGTYYTGALEVLPIEETVEVIRDAGPETDTIYVILDNTYTGRSIRTEIDEQTAAYTNTVTFLYPAEGANTTEITADIADLPESSAVLIITYYLNDQDLAPYHIDEISEEISAASHIPMYSTSSMFNDKGVVGGMQISPFDLGYDAGAQAMWLLEEAPVADTGPVIYTADTALVFDYSEMQRFDIPKSSLPGGATIINEPPDFITVDRDVAVAVIATALILSILVVILIIQNMALTKTREMLSKSEHLYRSVVDSQTEMITRFKTDGSIIFANPAYARYFGLDADSIKGQKFRARVHDDDRERVAAHFSALRTGTAHKTIEQRVVMEDGSVRWHRWDDHVITDRDGKATEYQSVGMDITGKKEAEQKIHESLQEKTVLLQEVHHRVKNNLAVISSMLEMQAVKEDEANPDVAVHIREAERRIRSMAAVHEELYRSDSFGAIDVQSHVERLAQEITGTFPNADRVTLEVEADACTLPLGKAIPVSLILNELLTNAMKYAFPESAKGIIHIKMQCDGAKALLTVRDTGIGFPSEFKPEESVSLGIQMVRTFVEYQLDGKYELTTGSDGTVWTIEFPFDTE